MSKTINAIYLNGVLRPLEPLHLNDYQLVVIDLVIPDEPTPEPAIKVKHLSHAAFGLRGLPKH